MKKCSICKEVKEFVMFGKSNRIKDGYRGQCKSCRKKAYQENKDSIMEDRKSYYQENKEKKKNYQKNYYKENRHTINKKRCEYIRNRKLNDNLFKLSMDISRSIKDTFRKSNHKKSSKTRDILGIDINLFKQYIENQFEPWMTWENKGLYNGEFNYGWDLDHIIPVSSATTEEELIKLNHYTNFQPLCSKVNRDIKKDKLDYEYTN